MLPLAACGGSSGGPGGTGGAAGGLADESRTALESAWWLFHPNIFVAPPAYLARVSDWKSGDVTNRLYAGFSDRKIDVAHARASARLRFDLSGLPGQIASAALTFEVLGLVGDPKQIGGLGMQAGWTQGAYDIDTPRRRDGTIGTYRVVARADALDPDKVGTKTEFVTDLVNQALAAGRQCIEFEFSEFSGTDTIDGVGDYYLIGSHTSVVAPPSLAIQHLP